MLADREDRDGCDPQVQVEGCPQRVPAPDTPSYLDVRNEQLDQRLGVTGADREGVAGGKLPDLLVRQHALDVGHARRRWDTSRSVTTGVGHARPSWWGASSGAIRIVGLLSTSACYRQGCLSVSVSPSDQVTVSGRTADGGRRAAGGGRFGLR